DGIRDRNVTGVRTCALPILRPLTAIALASVAFACSSADHAGYDDPGAGAAPESNGSGGAPGGGNGPGSPSFAGLDGGADSGVDRSEERRVGREWGGRGWCC